MKTLPSNTVIAIITGLALLLCASPLIPSASACSRILYNYSSNHVQKNVVARTMDLVDDDNAQIFVYPRGTHRSKLPFNQDGHMLTWQSKYGSVTVNSLGVATSDGINEKGLVVNLLWLQYSNYGTRDPNIPGVDNIQLVQYLLDVAATVDEAVAALKKIQVVPTTNIPGMDPPTFFYPLHYSISDATGASAVVEFYDPNDSGPPNSDSKPAMIITRKDTAVMTNEPPMAVQFKILDDKKYLYFQDCFYCSPEDENKGKCVHCPPGAYPPLPGDIDPTSRFVRASAFLKTIKNNNPSPATVQEALARVYSIAKTVSVPPGAKDSSGNEPGDAWPTRWTTLADPINKFYYFQPSTSPFMIWFDLKKIHFGIGQPIRWLSHSNVLTLAGEVSQKLSTKCQ